MSTNNAVDEIDRLARQAESQIIKEALRRARQDTEQSFQGHDRYVGRAQVIDGDWE